MRITQNEQVIFTDIDDTLVLHDVERFKHLPHITIDDPYCGTKRVLAYHPAHVRLLEERFLRGAHIKAMSAGGYAWAAAVIKSIGLDNMVAEALSKPIAILDDLPIEQALGRTMYLDPNSPWKANVCR